MKKSLFVASSISAALALMVSGTSFASVAPAKPAAADTNAVFALTSMPTHAKPVFLLAGRGADDALGHIRQGRGRDNPAGDNRVRTMKHGADDPAGDARRGRGADDPTGDLRKGRGADDPAGDNRVRTMKQGADDPAGDVRRGRGADDPAGDARKGRGRDDPANHG